MNILPGLFRGAGSIGSTLLASPADLGVALGIRAREGNAPTAYEQQGPAMDNALQSMGADPTNPGYKLGKVSAQVMGTAGAGGAISNGVRAVAPSIAARIPNLLQAVETSGMQGGNLLTRSAGGAVSGAAQAGLVDPSQAASGAVIGGALPGAVQLAGAAGRAVGRLVSGPAQTPEMTAAIQAARGEGYVIPPSQANPTLVNRALEGFSGKLTTAQNASARNAATTNRLAAETIGLPGDTVITPDVLNGVRRQAGQAYQALNGAGVITPGPAYAQALDNITAQARTAAAGFPNAAPNPLIARIEQLRSPQFDSSAAVAQTRELREAADAAAASGDRGLARSLRQGSDALENAIEAHLQQTGQVDLLNNFRAARQQIAQTYSIERALNPATGTVDANKLAAEHKKNRQLTGGLEAAAQFASRFPKAAQTPERMGSLPGSSPLDFAAAGGMSAASGNPLMMAGVLARPAARAITLSGPVQNRLARAPAGPNALQALIAANPGLAQLGYGVAPVAAANRP
jgi:hypothetical protein